MLFLGPKREDKKSLQPFSHRSFLLICAAIVLECGSHLLEVEGEQLATAEIDKRSRKASLPLLQCPVQAPDVQFPDAKHPRCIVPQRVQAHSMTPRQVHDQLRDL